MLDCNCFVVPSLHHLACVRSLQTKPVPTGGCETVLGCVCNEGPISLAG